MSKENDIDIHVCQGENYELRIKVNSLLQERQNILCKMERYRVRELDLMKQYDAEHKLRLDTKAAEERALKQSESMAELLRK